MTVIDLVSQLRQQGVKLWLEQDQLRCSAPKGVLTPELRATLGARKAELIEFLQEARAATRSPSTSVSKAPRPERIPLSFAQQRLWFLEQLEPGGPAYNIALPLRLRGVLDLGAFERACTELLRRHESLRTTFHKSAKGQPHQVIAPPSPHTVPVVSLEAHPPAEREPLARRLANEEAVRPFDLSKGPLVRTTLLRLAPEDHILLLTVHHIVSDGWSETVLVREVGTLYTAALAGAASPLPELPLQYADFSLWQRQWLQGEVLETQLSFWRKQLAGAPQVLELPSDRPRPTVSSGHGADYTCLLPRDFLDSLEALGRREGVTLFMTLLAAFDVLLHRYTGQVDLVVGTDVANRNRAELEDIIGFFVNQLAMRTRLDGDPTFRELLERVRRTALDAYAHQDLPFEELVKALNPERSRGHAPVFQVKLLVQDEPLSRIALPGLTVEAVEAERGSAKLDLTLFLTRTPRGLDCKWEYSTDLFDADTVRRMAAHYQMLLASVLENPGRRVSELPLLPQEELRQLLVEHNQTRAEYPKDTSVHALFEAQARRTPEAVAVAHKDERLSYRELDTRANQLAHRLRALGVGPEVVVGLCLERTPDLVVGLLGILKAGGAYLPLDPSYPMDRLAFMLRDARVPVLVTQERIADELPSQGEYLLCLDSERDSLSVESGEAPAVSVSPSQLAYVLYTSGSTGRPKGVMIDHRGVVNYLSWCVQAYRVAEGSGAPVHSSVSFDLTVTSLLSPLASGKTAWLVPEDDQVEGLAQALRSRSDFSLVKLTPTHLKLLSQQLPPTELGGLARALVIGGEALPAESLEVWRTHAPHTRLINEYGPTETVVGCCIHAVSALDARTGSVSIGRPIANTQLYVLDAHFQPVPMGVPGELYIGGDGVGRGYLGRPELTAERFVPDPFGGEPGARLYRTGDRARWLRDGTLDFLGRLDEQVKVRGYRIELGEIEAVLAQSPDVREVVVAAREEPDGGRRLVAYVVPEEGQTVDTAALRQAARSKLPEHMVPSAVVTLAVIPLSPNGKVDRKALPAPEALQAPADSYEPPRTPTEQLLASIWAQVLRIERVGVKENFFDLGGDSILAVQIIARANQAGLPLVPKQLFDHPTLAELAAAVGTAHTIQAEQGLVTGEVALTPIQHWFFSQSQPAPHHYNQALLLETREPLRVDLLEQALRHLLSHHDALRMRFEHTASGWSQHCAGPDDSRLVQSIDLSPLPEEARRPELESTCARLQESLDLAHGPLLKAAWFDFGEAPGRLLLLAHHLVVDGVSWRVLLEDLQATYQRLVNGESVHLPAKTTSYQAWAKRLREYAASPSPAFEYWRQLDVSGVARLPVDAPSSAPATVADTRTHSTALDAMRTRALSEVLKTYHCEINDVLLTALVAALAPWTGGRRWLIELEGHGREPLFDDVDVSRTVGWFTSLFPVVLEAPEGTPLPETLQAVKAQLRRIPQRGIDYGILRYLGQAAPHSIEPELVFNYLGRFDQVLDSALFRPAEESAGPTVSPKAPRTRLLEVNGLIHDDQLRMNWTYDPAVHHPATIEKLAERFLEALSRLISSDFPLARLAPADQERLRAEGSRVEDAYPLVLSQREMFEHTRAHPGGWAWFTQLSCQLSGGFSPDAFEQACRAVIARHTALRGSVDLQLAEPHQLVHRDVPLAFERHDWSHLSPERQHAAVAELLEADRARGFEARTPPLLRLELVRLAPEHFHLVFSSHHGVLDGWSMSRLFQEVFTLYQGLREGRPAELPAPTPFREVVRWIGGQDASKAEVFWRRTLAQAPFPAAPSPAPALPPEHERYQELTVRLDEATTESLRELARKHRITLNTLVQGAWALTLARHHRSNEVLFGATAAVRPVDIPGVEELVGHLINTLPVRVRLEPQVPVVEWLKALQSQQAEQRQFEHVPLTELRRWCGLAEGAPLFDSVIRFENYPIQFVFENAPLGFAVERFQIIDRWPYPLSLVVVPGPALAFELGYQRERIDADTAARLLSELTRLLGRIQQAPEQNLVSLME